MKFMGWIGKSLLLFGLLTEKAFDDDGNLKQPKQLSINKVGHGLFFTTNFEIKLQMVKEFKELVAFLHPNKSLSLKDNYVDLLIVNINLEEVLCDGRERFGWKLMAVTEVKEDGAGDFHSQQPGIGGEVVPHQDNSFLYTEPQTCTGLWLALEDATIINGCLWAIPGSQKDGLVRRFIRDEKGVHFDRPFPPCDQKDFVPIEVKAGTLVVIHGDLIHQSFENQSSKSRHAYSLHVVDTNGCKWAQDNWSVDE
ncbi:hypothetical protein RJ640_026050 [Escallonia rubra]|uniref:Phytanoyl-CoA dioxygenase n=1 Tax=Escallonia rubra TaxID=112253 RepID=A0AA88QYT2_9ASTE|nr:hypothetical protein RJ640_026050 [Escallonia rubra]